MSKKMLAWSRRRRNRLARGAQRPRCIVADTVNRTRADMAKTAEPRRVAGVGESVISTTPATRESGAIAACNQPRSFGLTSSLSLIHISEPNETDSYLV